MPNSSLNPGLTAKVQRELNPPVKRLLCVLNPGQSPWKAEKLWELSVLEFNICKQQACLSENFAGCILANLPKSLEALISSMEEITKFMYQYVSSI